MAQAADEILRPGAARSHEQESRGHHNSLNARNASMMPAPEPSSAAGILIGRAVSLSSRLHSSWYFLPGKEDHSLDETVKIPFSGTVKSVQVVDVDGDRRSDLLLVNWEDRNPFRFRLQKPDGGLGPEIYFPFPPIRSYWADAPEANEKTFVMTIAQLSGRVQISQFTRKAADTLSGPFQQGQLQVLPLGKTGKARRGVLWADTNGDARVDLLVAEPESGKLSVYFQKPDGSQSYNLFR